MTGVLRTYVHVHPEGGETVILEPGTKVPEEYADLVTNPACFVEEVESEQDSAPPAAPPAAPPVEPPAAPPVEPPAAPPVEPSEPVSTEPIDEQSFPELQKTAKARGLSGAGNKETLIARLQADDREKAALDQQSEADASAATNN